MSLSLVPQLKIAHKLPIIMSLVAVISASVVGYVSVTQSISNSILDAKGELSGFVDSRADTLHAYLETVKIDLQYMAQNPTTQKALTDYLAGWNALEADQTAKLQSLYIEQNSNKLGEKHLLDFAPDGSAYSTSHAYYHPLFRDFLNKKGLYDIFLFDTQGNVVYTVFKELDFATNVLNGQWKDSDLGNVYRKAIKLKKDETAFTDFAAYAPSNNVPASFIATPIVDTNGVTLGVIAYQMPVGNINKIMQFSEGLGKSGDTHLFGADLLARSDSRFNKGDTQILKYKAQSSDVTAALKGEKKATREMINDAWNISAATYLDFEGVRWAVESHVKESEILAGTYEMRDRILIIVGVILALSILISIIFSRGITKPISGMTSAMQKLAADDLSVEIPSQNRRDEVGDMAKTVQVFKQNAEEVKRMTAEQERLKAQAELDKKAAAMKLADDFEGRVSSVIQSLGEGAGSLRATAR